MTSYMQQVTSRFWILIFEYDSRFHGQVGPLSSVFFGDRFGSLVTMWKLLCTCESRKVTLCDLVQSSTPPHPATTIPYLREGVVEIFKKGGPTNSKQSIRPAQSKAVLGKATNFRASSPSKHEKRVASSLQATFLHWRIKQKVFREYWIFLHLVSCSCEAKLHKRQERCGTYDVRDSTTPHNSCIGVLLLHVRGF